MEALSCGQAWLDPSDANVCCWKEGSETNKKGQNTNWSLNQEKKLTSKQHEVAADKLEDMGWTLYKSKHASHFDFDDADTKAEAAPASSRKPLALPDALEPILRECGETMGAALTLFKKSEKIMGELLSNSQTSQSPKGPILVERITTAVEDAKDFERALEKATKLKRYHN